MSKIYLFKRVQHLPISVAEAWDFFSHPKNLHLLTPPALNLKFTNELFGDGMYPGQIITYKVKPILGIPLFWMTEITHVAKPFFFVDEQRRGPYLLWHHEHHFKETEGGVEMTDLIHYGIPFGIAGRLAHTLFVRKQLEEIFAYRFQKTEKLF
ncbi:MAG TPA: SRPBCC family protein, partial [Chitinophagaceae bacterium]|nr:SRPBCC family protein [Chitinophagaceae bacterium]